MRNEQKICNKMLHNFSLKTGMVIIIKESGSKTKSMEKVIINGTMEIHIKAIGEMIKLQEREYLYQKKEKLLLVHG